MDAANGRWQVGMMPETRVEHPRRVACCTMGFDRCDSSQGGRGAVVRSRWSRFPSYPIDPVGESPKECVILWLSDSPVAVDVCILSYMFFSKRGQVPKYLILAYDSAERVPEQALPKRQQEARTSRPSLVQSKRPARWSRKYSSVFVFWFLREQGAWPAQSARRFLPSLLLYWGARAFVRWACSRPGLQVQGAVVWRAGFWLCRKRHGGRGRMGLCMRNSWALSIVVHTTAGS